MDLPPFKDLEYALNDPKEFAAIKTCIGERFRALDHGNKGYLNKEEFGPVAESMLGASKGRTTHNRLMKMLGKEKNGKIFLADWENFVISIIRYMAQHERALEQRRLRRRTSELRQPLLQRGTS